MMLYICGFFYLAASYVISDKIGRHKKLGFAQSFLICIIATPFLGFLFVEGSASRNPPGCKWCGNKENEAVFCGICGKNEVGELRTNFKK